MPSILQDFKPPTTLRPTKSQAAFLNYPTGFACAGKHSVYQEMLAGGYASGKSFIGIQKGLFLSAMFPGNEGMICRLHGADLVRTVIPEFFKQCPEGWIRKVQNRDRANMIVHLVNGSIIYFQHIRDASQKGTKTRRTGHNLGWFLVEQAEEITQEEWVALNGRLRNSRAKVRFAMGNANPAGPDWLQKMFFPAWRPLAPERGIFFRTYVEGNRIGVHVDSEENRISNGGFVDDGAIDNYIQNSPPDMVARYIHGSFAAFTGTIYKEYSLSSVHNIEPLGRVPSSWERIGGIDVGGACAWSVLDTYVDTAGNLIVAGEFDKATPLVSEAAQWIKSRGMLDDNRTTFVIDPENKVATQDLADFGIFAVPARKSVLTNLQRVSGYLHLVQDKRPPEWMYEQLPEHAARCEREGTPRLFVVNTCSTFRKEHADAVWDDKQVNKLKKTKTERFDSVDTMGYICAMRPEARELAAREDPKIVALRKVSPLAAREMLEEQRLIAQIKAKQEGRGTAEMFCDFDDGSGAKEYVTVPYYD